MFNFIEAKRRAIEAQEKHERGEITEYEHMYAIGAILERVEDYFATGQRFKTVRVKTGDRGEVNAIWIDTEPPQRGKAVDIQMLKGRGNIAYNTNTFML